MKNFLYLKFIAAVFVLWVVFTAENSVAQNSPFRLTGFVSVVGGSVLSGNFPEGYSGPNEINKTQCPCYIADWANSGIYEKDFSLAQESRIGVQANYKFSSDASVTAQLVSRGNNATPNAQWAYGTYKINSQWEVQAGRKRIPLYFYSDFQDIGVSYPWITPPPEIYGWEVTNFNGASLRYNTQLDDISLTTSIFTGREKEKDSAYQKIYYSGSNQVEWNSLVGGDLELNYEYLTARLVYIQTDVRTKIFDSVIDTLAKLQAYGIAVNLDFDRYFFVSEFTQLKRNFVEQDYSYRAPALTLGGGVRLGQWTPFINYAKYTEHSSDLNQYSPQSFHRVSATLRYDLSSSTAIKIQLDKNTDVTRNFGGDTQIIRVSFDHVFE